MRTLYFIDYVENDGIVSQYGQATFDIEKANALFKEAVNSYGLDDFYTEEVTTLFDDCSNALHLRKLVVPKRGE